MSHKKAKKKNTAKKQKEKVVYYDDNSTIFDMSGVRDSRRRSSSARTAFQVVLRLSHISGGTVSRARRADSRPPPRAAPARDAAPRWRRWPAPS